MSTYATETDVANFIEGWTTQDVYALERLIQRSEQDIDTLLVRTGWENPPSQVISLGSSGQTPSGGSYTLGFEGVDTTSLSFNSTAGQIESALSSLAAISSDNNAVPNVTVLGANPYTVLWNTDWARDNFTGQEVFSEGGNNAYRPPYDVPLLTIDNSALGVSTSIVEVPGRKVNPIRDLDRNQQLALARATCAQVEYRWQMGEPFFVRPQFGSVKGPDFTTTGKLPMIGPKVQRELFQVGLLQTSGRAIAGRVRRGLASGWPTY